jgi:hypothetical protein
MTILQPGSSLKRKTKQKIISHTMTKLILDFWLEPGIPYIQRHHMDPKRLGTEVGMVLELHPAKIGAPFTPGQSQGTKIFVSKFCFGYSHMMLFYAFCGFVDQKMLKLFKNCPFSTYYAIHNIKAKKLQFC